MVSLLDMKQAARVVKDENGNPVVQVPLAVWEAVVREVEEKQPQTTEKELTQAERIKAVLKSWENEPDDKSEEWWAEFEQFLKDNRVNFPDRNLDFGEE